MEHTLKIGEFARLTGVTVKTVLHYHKVGLLPEVPRTASGYRIYGAVELNRMLYIKRMKSLGLNLEQIKKLLGTPEGGMDLRSVLLAIQDELQKQIDNLNLRMMKIQHLLNDNCANPGEIVEESSSFKMVVDILGEAATEQYQNVCPEMYELERKMYGVIDNLDWGIEPRDSFRMVAEYFRDHPVEYQESLDYGARITALGDLEPDSPEVEDLARSYSVFIKNLPFYEVLLTQESLNSPLESMFNGMLSEFLSPAQLKMLELLGQYLAPEEKKPEGVNYEK